MTRATFVFGLLALVATPAISTGQTPARPPVEVGLELSSGPDGAIGWSAVGPRVTANLTNRTALELSFAPERDRSHYLHVDHVFIHMKRTLMSRDAVSLFGTLGVSAATRYFDNPDFPLEPQTSWGPTFGFGAEVPLFAYLRPRGEVEYVLSQEALLRFSGGVSVPLGGRYPTRAHAADRPGLEASPAGQVGLGQTVWIGTSEGRVVHGEVVSRSADGITLSHRGGVTSIAMTEIQGIDATDHLLNGVLVGAAVGAAGGGALGMMGSRIWCEGDDGCVVLGALLLGGLGGGIGTLAGAVVDSFRDSPRPVYRRGAVTGGATVTLTPVASARGLGAAGVITW